MMRIRHVSCREILAGNILHRIPAKKLQHPSPNFGICVVLVHGSHRINAFVRQEADFNPLVGLPVICQRLTFSWIGTARTIRSLGPTHQIRESVRQDRASRPWQPVVSLIGTKRNEYEHGGEKAENGPGNVNTISFSRHRKHQLRTNL